ncbi:MAG: sensor domain-containing diguanylate cyclase [Ruminococcus sp.]|nr:sensor domain-containing diguanylate cyclase [Ruminococcus sp.]
MTELKLKVINDVSDRRILSDLSISDFPDGVYGTAVRYDKSEVLTPEGGALLIITDNAVTAKKFLREVNDRIHLVYIGSVNDIPEVYDVAEDVWNPADGEAMLKKRYIRLLKKMKCEFDLWFYRHTLETTINTVPDMLWYKRIDGIHMLVNNAFTNIVHKPKSDIHGKDHFYIWDAPRPDEGNDFACAESEEIAISTGKTYICDEPVKTREGMKQFTTYKTPVYDMYGNIFGTVGIGHDVTNFSNLGIELSILVEHMPFPMTIFTPDWKVVRMNTHFRNIVCAENVEKFDYKAWKRSVPIPAGKRKEDKTTHSASREYQINVDGEIRSFMLTELEIHDYFDNVSGYFCTMQDITYQRAYEQSIINAANTDMLTGMYNRRYFYNFLSGNIGKSFHLLYLDLDRFKAINDNFGHSAGDEVLIKTSELIQDFFPDAVTARLGGDEFAVIDYENSRKDIESICSQLENTVLNTFKHYNCNTTISIGITYTDGSAEDIDTLIQESDTRMYEEKKKHHR